MKIATTVAITAVIVITTIISTSVKPGARVRIVGPALWKSVRRVADAIAVQHDVRSGRTGHRNGDEDALRSAVDVVAYPAQRLPGDSDAGAVVRQLRNHRAPADVQYAVHGEAM